MDSKQPPKEPRSIGKHLPRAGSNKPETEVEKADREGADILRKFLKIQIHQLEIMEVRSRALDNRIVLQGEIEKEVLNPKFFNSLEAKDKIYFWKALDLSVQREAGLDQKLQAQSDVFQTFHNYKKMVDHLLFLEQEKEFKQTELPYSPEFRAKVRQEYLDRVLGRTAEPVNQTDEEDEENGSEEVD